MAASATPRPTAADPGALIDAALRAASHASHAFLASPARPAPAALAEPAAPAAPPFLPLAVALSGGADSTALLLAAVRAWPGQVRAIHVHHGLQAAAEGFERHCRDLCERLHVPLAVCRVQAAHAPGESPEDAARRARYAALAAQARADVVAAVWLGHQADDQVETLLLALSRGAGLPGLAAMGPRFEREGVVFMRPLLEVPGAALRQWLQAQGQAWVEDPTNADTGLTRNRIRLGLLPALEEAFPSFRQTFARSSRHAAQAQALLAEVAREDLAALGAQAPSIAGLQALSAARQANALRQWLRDAHGVAPSEAQLQALMVQVAACRTRGHRIELLVAGGTVTRDGEVLRFRAPGSPAI